MRSQETSKRTEPIKMRIAHLMYSVVFLCLLVSPYCDCEVLATAQQQDTTLLPQQYCFVSCVCSSFGQISCLADEEFLQDVSAFNQFLFHNTSKGLDSHVHIQVVTVFVPLFFRELPLLRFLSLAGNSIRIVQDGALMGMHLRQLNLSHNALQTIEPAAFQGLSFLRMLDLSHNELATLSRHVFSDLPSLEVLNLDSNHLVFFPFDQDSNVPRLQELFLNDNKLSYLVPGGLVSLPALRDLHLRGNSLSSFEIDVVLEVPRLRILDVSGNPFHCSCALKGLAEVLNSTSISLMESNRTSCATPLSLRHTLVQEVESRILMDPCTEPKAAHDYDTQEIYYLSTVKLTCDVQGDPDPAVLWVTPWGHRFADKAAWPKLEAVCGRSTKACRQELLYKGIGIFRDSRVSVGSGGKTLSITNFRSYFNGNVVCQAYNHLGNATAVHHLETYVGVQPSVHSSIMVGGFCAASFLCLGLIIGSIKLLVLACLKRFGKVKKVVWTPETVVVTTQEELGSIEEEDCHGEDSDDFFDFYPPETPFTTPTTAASPTMSPHKTHSPGDGDGTPPGGWLPSNILETMEEVRWRLRYGVGRKVETMKRNVHAIKETGIRNVNAIKESGSVYVHNIMESGSTAAHKVRAGMVIGVETVKYHVQSIKEFCGTGDMGTQTISMISVETNLDTNETREVVKSITIV